jgi:hypothetical protein
MRRLPQFHVMKKQCDECPFSDNTPAVESVDVLEQCADKGSHFICRKVSDVCPQQLQEAGDICCRGFYDHDPGATVAMRLAQILNIVVFVDIPSATDK